MGVYGAVYLTLTSTNPIENLNGAVAHHTRSVKRWGGGKMALRWVGAAQLQASARFRKVRGPRDMPKLYAAHTGMVKKLSKAAGEDLPADPLATYLQKNP